MRRKVENMRRREDAVAAGSETRDGAADGEQPLAVGAGRSAEGSTGARPRIEVSHVSKRYGDLVALDDVTLTIGEREAVSVVGPSGCGKTTLLRCIEGLVPTDEGEIRIDGARVTEPPEGVAMVFQHFGLFPWKTVFANVAYGLKVAGRSKSVIQATVPQYIELVGLKGFEKSYPYQLSGGMQQRAGLARALAVEPRALMMDEPFGALDAQTREKLQFELLRIWYSRPTSMVFVTHSIEESILMGDRVVIMTGRPGRIFEIIDVGLPHPREREVIGTPEFVELREYAWRALQAAQGDAGPMAPGV